MNFHKRNQNKLIEAKISNRLNIIKTIDLESITLVHQSDIVICEL